MYIKMSTQRLIYPSFRHSMTTLARSTQSPAFLIIHDMSKGCLIAHLSYMFALRAIAVSLLRQLVFLFFSLLDWLD